MASVTNAFLPLAAFLSPHKRFVLRAYVLGEGGRRTAVVLLTQRRAANVPSSAAIAALRGAGRGQGRAARAARRQVSDAAPAGRRRSTPPGALSATLLGAPHRSGLDQPPALPRERTAGSVLHCRALASPLGVLQPPQSRPSPPCLPAGPCAAAAHPPPCQVRSAQPSPALPSHPAEETLLSA